MVLTAKGVAHLSRLVALAESGANGMVIADLPEKMCMRCMFRSESGAFPGQGRADEYLRQVHIDIAGPMC